MANLNPKTLLMPDIDHNSKNENAQNLLIKGDNLEVLKHLKNAYFESIKMIYIDPPYNTGGDGFVYKDDRKFSVDELSNLAGISQEEAKRVLEFTAKGSNSHSAWLSFIYPRLYIARELLRDDGVIFISIDDNEQAQLKILCDEIFGEENFVANLIWQKKKGGSQDSQDFSKEHEYILCYKKKDWQIYDETKEFTEDDFNKTINNKKANIIKLEKWGAGALRIEAPTLYYPIKDPNDNDFFPVAPNGEDGCWRKKPENLDKDHIFWQENSRGRLTPYEVIYFDEVEKEKIIKTRTIFTEFGTTTEATKEIQNLFNNKKVFDTPKPTNLLKKLMQVGTDDDDIILDFFAGSGTTSHAVMAQNLEDGGNRKFILVQLDEKIDERNSKVAYDFCKNELKSKNPTIFDITKERILRAAQSLSLSLSLSEDDARLKFKIFSTVPLLKSYLDKYLDGDPDTKELNLFPKNELSKDDLIALLTTFAAYDGIKLTDELKRADLGGYEAYYAQKKLYLINENFNGKNLKALVEKIDSDKEFAPEKIVIYEPSFESSRWRELDEAIKNYANKKNLQISLIARH